VPEAVGKATAPVVARVSPLEDAMAETKLEFAALGKQFHDLQNNIANASCCAAAVASASTAAPSPVREPDANAKWQVHNGIDKRILEVKGFGFDTLSWHIMADVRKCAATSGPPLDNLAYMRCPVSRCAKCILTFNTPDCAQKWLAAWREYPDSHPVSWRSRKNEGLYVTTVKAKAVREPNALSWKMKQLLLENLEADQKDRLELVWGRHVILARSGELQLGSLNLELMRYDVGEPLIRENYGQDKLDRLLALINLANAPARQ
jgi:hypothetical protein